MPKQLEVIYTRSAIGRLPNQRKTIQALGLRKLQDRALHDDNPSIRGMIRTVAHLVTWREIDTGESA
jgi:large subunit ribosomal protein L30